MEMENPNPYEYKITLIAPRLIGEPALHHYVSTDSYDMIRSDISFVCTCLGIEKKNKAPSGFRCSSFKNQFMIEFDIDIYSNRNLHVVDFRLISGEDGFAFAELLYEIQEQLECNIVGSRNFKKFDDVLDLTHQEQMYEFIQELMDSNTPDYQRDSLQTLQTLASYSRQISGHTIQSNLERFVSSTSKVVLKAIEYKTDYLFLVSALADYFLIPTKFDTDILAKAKELTLAQPMDYLGYHERRETIRLAVSIRKFYTLDELEHFNIKVNDDKVCACHLITLLL